LLDVGDLPRSTLKSNLGDAAPWALYMGTVGSHMSNSGGVLPSKHLTPDAPGHNVRAASLLLSSLFWAGSRVILLSKTWCAIGQVSWKAISEPLMGDAVSARNPSSEPKSPPDIVE